LRRRRSDMVVDEMREIRQAAVQSMQEALDNVEPLDAPAWLVVFGMAPVFLWMVLKITVMFALGLFKKWAEGLWCMVKLPFIMLAMLADTIVLLVWFFKRIMQRMGE
jgi:hypothetical protein